MAARVAIAVPQMPIRWTRLLNRPLFDDDARWPRGNHPALDAKRQCERRSCRMTGWKTKRDWTAKVREDSRHRVARARLSGRLVAAWQLAEDDGGCSSERVALLQLRDHAIETIWTFAHFVEKQDVTERRIERERRAQR